MSFDDPWGASTDAFALRVEAVEAERDAAVAESVRLRELYENVVGNRERFGWTINHLLECEEALRMVEGAATEAVAERDSLQREVERLRSAANAIYARHNGYCPPGSWRTPGHDVILAEWQALGEALSEPGDTAG